MNTDSSTLETQTSETTDAGGIAGLTLRPYRGAADHPHVVSIQNAEFAADGIRGRVGLADVDAWLSHPSEQFDPWRDLRVAELDGTPVAVAWIDWIDTTDGLREYRTRGFVVPEARCRGIGTALFADGLRRIEAMAAGHATDRPKVVGTFSDERSVGAPLLAASFGLEPVRWFFDMERTLLGDLPDVPDLPDGLVVRPVTADDGPAIWRADHDAFRDHWGGHDSSEASYLRWRESPEFDPSLFIVAFDGDEIAAAVLNVIYDDENKMLGIKRGWLESVFTRRAWRRRGLGRALIARSFHLLRERGMEIAALTVDADNPSGALSLYESVGFAVTERATAWRRPL